MDGSQNGSNGGGDTMEYGPLKNQSGTVSGASIPRGGQGVDPEYLRKQAAAQMSAAREMTPQEMLLQRAMQLRDEAGMLEALAAALPNSMQWGATEALRSALRVAFLAQRIVRY